MSLLLKAKSGLWLLYFLLSIAVLGLTLLTCLSLPLLLIGEIITPLKKPGQRLFSKIVHILLQVQPWLKMEEDWENLSKVSTEKKGLLVVSNHRSHLDAFFILANIHGVRILAKQSLFWIPFLGLYMWATKQIPVKGKGPKVFLSALEDVKNGLKDKNTIHIFPEMTRCNAGYQGTLPFALPPFWLALQEGLTILPVAIKGTDQVWPKGKIGLNSGKKIIVKALDPVDSSMYQTAEHLRSDVEERIKQAIL